MSENKNQAMIEKNAVRPPYQDKDFIQYYEEIGKRKITKNYKSREYKSRKAVKTMSEQNEELNTVNDCESCKNFFRICNGSGNDALKSCYVPEVNKAVKHGK